MHWLLQDFMLLDPWDQLLSILFSLFTAFIALAGACNEQVRIYDRCLCASFALVTLFSFSTCCVLLHTIIVAKCLSLGPFSVLPLPPCPDFDSVEPLVVSNSRRVLCIPPNVGKNQEEGKCPIDYLSFRNSFAKVNWYGRDGYYSRNISDTVRMLGFELYISEDEFGSGVSPHARKVESASRVKASPAEPTDEVDLLCEQFAAMHFGASAQASAYVQHQDEPSSLVPADTVRGAVGMPSLEDDADANSLAYQHSTPSSSTGRSFPDCDVEMGDSIFEDSNQIPSAAAGEVGPVAMDIMGDSLSMDNHAQEQRQQQYSSAGPHATVALHTAAALAFMSRAQEQSLPEEHTPVYGADDYSVSDSGQEIIAAAAAVEDSEHVQDVGDSTASDALDLAIAANMLPSLEQSNITTVGDASLVDVSSDFPTMTEAATLVEESNDEVGGEEGDGEASLPIPGDEGDRGAVYDFSIAVPFARVVRASAVRMATMPTIEEEDEDAEEGEEGDGEASVPIPGDEGDRGAVYDFSIAVPFARVVRASAVRMATLPTIEEEDEDAEEGEEGDGEASVPIPGDEGDRGAVHDFPIAVPFARVVRASAVRMATLPTIEEEDEDAEEGEEGEEEDPAVVPDASVAAPSARGVKRGREATDDGTFSTDDDEYASGGRRRVDEGDSNSSTSQEGQSEENGDASELIQDQDAAVVPDSPPAAPSTRGVKRGREATDDGTFSTEDGEYASVARRRVDEGDSDSTDHGQSEEVRVGDDELENDDEAVLLPPPQTTPPPTVDVLAEILDESDEDFYS